MILNIYKPEGLTPLEVIKIVKEKFPEYKNSKIGYAGRLDPLAHGVLLLMVGDETTKQRDKFLNLPKEYEFEIAFGITTDTYDALGLIQNTNCHPEFISGSPEMLKQVQHDIEIFINSKFGKQTQAYPPYSSKTINGKPLFQWAKENKLKDIEIPKREIEIYDFKLLNLNQISTKNLENKIFQQINSVAGDFRQEEIKNTWSNFFSMNHKQITNNQFVTAKLKISCSSGTYIRSITNELGNELGYGAITLEILRTKVGEYKLNDSIKLI